MTWNFMDFPTFIHSQTINGDENSSVNDSQPCNFSLRTQDTRWLISHDNQYIKKSHWYLFMNIISKIQNIRQHWETISNMLKKSCSIVIFNDTEISCYFIFYWKKKKSHDFLKVFNQNKTGKSVCTMSQENIGISLCNKVVSLAFLTALLQTITYNNFYLSLLLSNNYYKFMFSGFVVVVFFLSIFSFKFLRVLQLSWTLS